LLVPPKHTIPLARGKTKKRRSRHGRHLDAGGFSVYGASQGGTLGLTDALLRGASLSGTLLLALAGALLRGVSLSGTLPLDGASHIC
jgi:hypothetical protein